MLKKLGSEGKNRNQPIHRPTLTDYLDLDFNVKIVISKGFVRHKRVKINHKKEQCFVDIVTRFSSSNTLTWAVRKFKQN